MSGPDACVDISEATDDDFQAESDFEAAVSRSFLFDFDFPVAVDGEVDLCDLDVFFGVEVVGEVLVVKDLVTDEHALADVDATKLSGFEGAAADRYVFGASVFDNEKVVVAEGGDAPVFVQRVEEDVGTASMTAEGEGFEGGYGIGGGVSEFVCFVQLSNDVDGLGGHPELGHEGVEGGDFVLVETGTRDEIVELDTEHHFSVGAELGSEFGGHASEVLLLLESFAEQGSKFGVNGFGEVVAQESERGVDVCFDELTFAF